MTHRPGRGAALVLLPGGPGLDNYLKPLAELLSPRTQVILPGPPSAKAGRASPATIVAMTAELERLRIDAGIAQWVVGGHSFGADLALAYALEHPDRTAGVLSISGTGVQDDRQWHEAYEAGRTEGRDPDYLEGIPFDAVAHRVGVAAWRAYIKQAGLLVRIGRLPMEFQAIYGSEDVRPRWPIDQLVALIPDGHMNVIEGAGHWPWLTHPRETHAIIEAFLCRAASTVAGSDAAVTAPIQFAGIDHVQLAMPVGREDQARRFYAGALGLREVPKPPGLAARGGCWFSSADGRVAVHLGIDPDFRPARKAHPAFAVANLDSLRYRLGKIGAEVVDDDAIEVRRFYTTDPFGNRIELIEASRWCPRTERTARSAASTSTAVGSCCLVWARTRTRRFTWPSTWQAFRTASGSGRPWWSTAKSGTLSSMRSITAAATAISLTARSGRLVAWADGLWDRLQSGWLRVLRRPNAYGRPRCGSSTTF